MQIRDEVQSDPSGPHVVDLRPLLDMQAEMCQAMANPHRLAIVYALRDGERCVGELASTLGISVHNVSQHLRILRERLLVRPRKEGQTVYYSMTTPKFVQACALICEALAEQHRAEGECLQAVGLLEFDRHHEGVGQRQTDPTRPNVLKGRTAMHVEGNGGGPVDLTSLQADKLVDARGTSCPGPILAAKKGMPGAKVGEIMEVLATDSTTLKDLPAWSKKMGHEYLGHVEEAGYWKLFVRKLK